MMISLGDKVSIITGASSGIGQGTAVLFARLGSKLVLSGRSSQGLDDTINQCDPETRDNIIKVVGDITVPEMCKVIVDEAIKKFGKIDILVNNAGILKTAGIETMQMKDYDELMNTNIKAVINLTQLCIPHLLEQKGSIVNVSSIAGLKSFPNILAYCMSKAALDQFTKCVALDLASRGVRVNSVNPGVILTNIQRRNGLTEEQYRQYLEDAKLNHAMGRPGHVIEVANTIAFLASDLASFTTGELIQIDGGRHLMGPIDNN